MIEGTVVTPEGAPIEEAAVMLVRSPEPHEDIALLTDSQGRYRFAGLPFGEYEVQVVATGFAPHRATLEVGSVPARVRHEVVR